MTESEWLASTDPKRMFRHLTHCDHFGSGLTSGVRRRLLMLASPRQLRLFALAVIRCQSGFMHWTYNQESKRVYDLAESLADRFTYHYTKEVHADPLRLDRGPVWFGGADPLEAAETAAGWDGVSDRHRANALRDIVGNPFRFPSVAGETNSTMLALSQSAAPLRTDLIVSLAIDAYRTRTRRCMACNRWTKDCQWCKGTREVPAVPINDGRLGILADAIEDMDMAPAFVAHLRDARWHFRGCWALDAILTGVDDFKVR